MIDTVVVSLSVLLAAAVVVLALRVVYLDSERFRNLWERVERLEQDRMGMRDELHHLRGLVSTLSGWVQLLRNQLVLHDVTPPNDIPSDMAAWLRNGGKTAVNRVITPAKLSRLLAAHFNIDEIDNLAFDLGLSPENIDGTVASVRARELVSLCERLGRLGDLMVGMCDEEREGLFDWC